MKDIILDSQFRGQLSNMLNDAYGRYVYVRLVFELTWQIPPEEHIFCREKDPNILQRNWKIWSDAPAFWTWAHLTASSASILAIARLFDVSWKSTVSVSFATVFANLSIHHPAHVSLFFGLLSFGKRINRSSGKEEEVIVHESLLHPFRYNRDAILAHVDYKKAAKQIPWKDSETVLNQCYNIMACIDNLGSYPSEDFRIDMVRQTVSQTEEIFRRFRQYPRLSSHWSRTYPHNTPDDPMDGFVV